MTDNFEPSPRNTILAFAIIALAIIGGAVLLLVTRPEPVKITINPPLPTATSLPTATPAPITVYVTGAVNQPETTITLPAGSRVQEALDMAGGITENADLERVNLAQILRDGDQVHVPELNEMAEITLPTPSGGITIVYVNSATVEELMTLPGVGEALAQRIIDYRTANGAFADLSALDNVSGIGPAMLENLAGLIAFD
jgi:competence protein ComEA